MVFDRDKEGLWEQILRIRAEKAKFPYKVPRVSLALSSPGLYTHILKVGEVVIFKSSPIGYHSVLVRKTFTAPNGLINIEFGTGYILQVESSLLF